MSWMVMKAVAMFAARKVHVHCPGCDACLHVGDVITFNVLASDVTRCGPYVVDPDPGKSTWIEHPGSFPCPRCGERVAYDTEMEAFLMDEEYLRIEIEKVMIELKKASIVAVNECACGEKVIHAWFDDDDDPVDRHVSCPACSRSMELPPAPSCKPVDGTIHCQMYS